MVPNERPSFTRISAFRFVFCLLFRILLLTQPDFASPREIAILRSPRMALLIEITRCAQGMPHLRALPPWLRVWPLARGRMNLGQFKAKKWLSQVSAALLRAAAL